ncbi:MAG: cupin domain-containing protein [Clostridiales bacterium]|nr:cupin domain-containing protein [Clostridiales bacterium]
MLIDFLTMQEEAIPAFKGGEKEYNVKMFSDESNKIMRGRLTKGASIGFHTHTDNCEVIFVLSGEGEMVDDAGNTEEIVRAGQCTYCPKGCSHSFVNKNDEDLIFFAVVAG